jgi:hypothetical protein
MLQRPGSRLVYGRVMLRVGMMVMVVAAGCASAKGTPDVDATPGCVVAPERCNGNDDDCDNHTDEDFPELGEACSLGTGACTGSGRNVCAQGGQGVVCEGGLGDPDAEACDGEDNDCDTRIDEGLDLGLPCDGNDSDACNEGVKVCGIGGAVVCSDVTSSSTETCNGVDDDCRNGTDDGFGVGASCSVGIGGCRATGRTRCAVGGSGVECDAVEGDPEREYCGDGIDDDCDGSDPSACPSNDLPDNPVDISAGGRFTADLTYAHNRATSIDTCGEPGGRDVFFTFTLPSNEVIYFDTFGSNFDAVVRIFAGTCAAQTSLLACIDDTCLTTQAQLGGQLGAGTYCLIVDQYSIDEPSGNLVLNFLRGGRPGTQLSPLEGSETGNTSGGTNHSSPTAGCAISSNAPDVGFFFTACPGEQIDIDAETCGGATWDTVLYFAVGSGAGVATGSCSDDVCLQQSRAGASITGPGLYWFIVDGYGTASGAFTLFTNVL